jgi:hypothetical protein
MSSDESQILSALPARQADSNRAGIINFSEKGRSRVIGSACLAVPVGQNAECKMQNAEVKSACPAVPLAQWLLIVIDGIIHRNRARAN